MRDKINFKKKKQNKRAFFLFVEFSDHLSKDESSLYLFIYNNIFFVFCNIQNEIRGERLSKFGTSI